MPGTVKPICPGLRLGAMPSADLHTDSLPIGTLSVVAHVLRKHGHDADALLRRHGVGVRTLSDPLAPSPIHLHGRVVQDAIDTSGIEHLPLLLGAQAQLDNVGPVRTLALNAPTAREALASLLRYARIWYRGIRLTLESDQGYAMLAYETDALCGQPALGDRLSGRRRAQPGASLRHRMAPGPCAHGAAPAGGLCALHRVRPRAGVVRPAAP